MFPIEYYLVVPSNNRPLGKQNNLLLYECIYIYRYSAAGELLF